jgi:DNA primase
MTARQKISRPDKVLCPDPGLTKPDIATYYESVAEVLLPHLADRPLTMHRFPDGVDDEGFYQKQAPSAAPPDTVTVQAQNERGRVDHLVVDAYAQTAVVPYSLRARPKAPIATPIDFAELGRVEPDRYDATSVVRRLGRKTDPWTDMTAHAGSVERARTTLGAEDESAAGSP